MKRTMLRQLKTENANYKFYCCKHGDLTATEALSHSQRSHGAIGKAEVQLTHTQIKR